MEVHGACHCRAIEFTAHIDPSRVVLCHCTDCQVMSGGPYRSIAQANEDEFKLLKGALTLYHKVGDSGNSRELGFCNLCGSHIYATSYAKDHDSKSNRILGLRAGTLAEAGELPPKLQVWCQSLIPWAQDITGLPQKERQ